MESVPYHTKPASFGNVQTPTSIRLLKLKNNCATTSSVTTLDQLFKQPSNAMLPSLPRRVSSRLFSTPATTLQPLSTPSPDGRGAPSSPMSVTFGDSPVKRGLTTKLRPSGMASRGQSDPGHVLNTNFQNTNTHSSNTHVTNSVTPQPTAPATMSLSSVVQSAMLPLRRNPTLHKQQQRQQRVGEGVKLDLVLNTTALSPPSVAPAAGVVYLSSSSPSSALHPLAVHLTNNSAMLPGVAVGAGALGQGSLSVSAPPSFALLESVASITPSDADIAFERELARLTPYHNQIDRICQIVSAQTSFIRLASVLAQQVAALVGADRVRVLSVSPTHGLSMISVGAVQHHLGFIGLSGVSAKTRRVVNAMNPARDPQYEPLVDSIPHQGGPSIVGSLLVVPVECDVVVPSSGQTTRELIALIQCTRLPVSAATKSAPGSKTARAVDIAYLPFDSKDAHAVFRVANMVGNAMQHIKTIDQTKALYTASLEWHQRFASVLRVANTLLSENHLDKVVGMIVAQVPELLDADRCTLYFTDGDRKELIATKGASHGRPKTFISWIFGQSNAPELPFPPGQNEIRFPMNRGLAGHVALTGETLNIHDAHGDSRFNAQVDKDTGYKTRNMLCVPMCDDNKNVIGVVQAINKNPLYPCFDQEDEAVLHTFAAQASLAVRNSLLFGKTKKAWQQSDALLEVTKALSSELNMDALLRIIVAKVQKLIRAEKCTVFIVDREQRELYTNQDMSFVGNSPHTDHDKSITRFPMDRGIPGAVATSLAPVNIPDAYLDTRFDQQMDKVTGFRTRSVLCMAISIPNKLDAVGVIQCVNKRGPKVTEAEASYTAKFGSGHVQDSKLVFDHDDEKLLAAFCTQAAVAIENSRLFTETEKALNHALMEKRNIKLYMSVTKKLVSGTHMRMLVEQLRLQVHHLLKADDCALYLVDPVSLEMWLPTEDEMIPVEVKSRRFRVGQGLVGACAESGQLISISSNAFLDPRFNPIVDQRRAQPPHSILCAPIKADASAFLTQKGNQTQHSVVIGVVVVCDEQDKGGFEAQEKKLLNVFAAQAGLALLHKLQLENMVMQDFKEQDKGAANYLQHERGMNIATTDIENFFYSLNDLQLIQPIGAGSYGEVYKAILRNQIVAVKKLHAKSLRAEQVEAFCQEASLMCQLKNPNIVGFVGAVTDPSNLCIITEYCDRGSLADILLNPNIKMGFAHKIKCALAAAQGMNYLHKSNPVILHRDLKSDNLLLDEKWQIKVADFGLTRFLSTDKKAMTQVGTPMWMAPEIIMGKKYTEKADVYAFGIILWELLSRLEPYEDKEPMQIVVEVVNKGLRPIILPEFANSPLTPLMTECWSQDPEPRPSFDVIVDRLRALVKKYDHANVDDYGMPSKRK